MTPKEKALEIYNKMYVDINYVLQKSHKQAKECSIILVNEVIKELNEYDTMDGYTLKRIDFYNQVITHLEEIN